MIRLPSKCHCSLQAMQGYCLCLRRVPWLDRKRTNADPHYINTELRTVSYQASPEGQQLGQRLVWQLPWSPSPSAPLLARRQRLKQEHMICDSEEFEENYFLLKTIWFRHLITNCALTLSSRCKIWWLLFAELDEAVNAVRYKNTANS